MTKKRTRKASTPQGSVVYTGPVRKEKLTMAMFERVSARLTADADEFKNWEKYIPFTPEQMIDVLLRDLPADTHLRVNIDENGDGTFYYSGSAFESSSVSFNLKKKVRESGDFTVAPGDTGRRIGTTHMRNQFEFFAGCGVKKFHIYAARHVGGYAWAKLGFMPKEIRGSAFNKDVRQEVKQRFSLLRTFMDAAQAKEVAEIAKLRKPEDLWRLANCTHDMREPLKSIFNQAAKPNSKTLDEIYDNDQRDYIRAQVKRGKHINLGKLLLMGTDWNGFVRLNDPAQMARIGKYLGWNNIKIT